MRRGGLKKDILAADRSKPSESCCTTSTKEVENGIMSTHGPVKGALESYADKTTMATPRELASVKLIGACLKVGETLPKPSDV